MAGHVGWKPALIAALGKVGETLAVEQVTLTAPLAYTLPAGTPAGVVHRVTFTQDGTGGHTVTYGGAPVSVDLTAGASTTVELHPIGTGYVVRYPAPPIGTAAGTIKAGDWKPTAADVTDSTPAGRALLTGADVAAQRATLDVQRRAVFDVRDFGAKGDGTADDTAAIQRALDGARGVVYFPPGIYRVTGSGAACLTLTRNVDLVGLSQRDSVIRADNAGPNTAILKVAITENWGMLDVRSWNLRNLRMFHNGGGLHGLIIDGTGMQLLTAKIDNCGIGGSPGHSLYVDGNLAHSSITHCTLSTAWMACLDANRIEKCLFSGTGNAITYDLITGVRNNVVRDCTIVNRDGVVRIINGDNLRIENNQCEQRPALSQSPHSTMVWIEGVARPVINTIVSGNNFGGGTNLDRLIYVDNARMTVIEKNNLVAVGTSPNFNGYEVEVTSAAERTFIRPDNYAYTQPSNPRDYWAPRVLDNGTGTIYT